MKKVGGSLKDSFLCDGLILEKNISVGCQRFRKNAPYKTKWPPIFLVTSKKHF